MKKLVAYLIVAGVVFAMTSSASAVAPFHKQFAKTYVEDNKEVSKEFAEAVKAAKCNLCHYGKSKKNRNEYGKELGKLLKKDDFKTSAVKADPKGAEKAIVEAFEKVAKLKNADGVTFGDLIKEGKLPAVNPEE
jgi:hypothetical protein